MVNVNWIHFNIEWHFSLLVYGVSQAKIINKIINKMAICLFMDKLG